jgi:hypothetical protein
MASHGSDTLAIPPLGQGLHSHERDWSDSTEIPSDWVNLDVPDDDVLHQYFLAQEFVHLDDQSEPKPLVQLRLRPRGDLDGGRLGQPREPLSLPGIGPSSYFKHNEQTLKEWNFMLMDWIRQMMFVSGETSEASVETTTIIEEIVHTQVTEIVSSTVPPGTSKSRKC